MCDVDWPIAAAWVQAVGSVAAIIAAILIARSQHQQNIRLVEAERIRQQEDADRLTNERKDAIRQVTKSYRSDFDDLLVGITEALVEGASPTLQMALTKIVRSTDSTTQALERIKDTLILDPRSALAFHRVIELIADGGRISNAGVTTLTALHSQASSWVDQYEQALVAA